MLALPITRRVAGGFAVIWLLAASVYFLYRRNPEFFPSNAKPSDAGGRLGVAATQHCQGATYDPAQMAIWEAATARYAHLADDKFTAKDSDAKHPGNDRIAISTYHRPVELNITLTALLSSKVPSLHEIVVLWGNLDEETPAGFTSEHGVPVRYRRKARNSLNEKFLPDPLYATRAILLSDDDVYYEPTDLEFTFQTWRSFGRTKLTGALGRCVARDASGEKLNYNFCEHRDTYNLVLTNLAFIDVSFLDYFASADPIVTRLRDHVDEVFNCDDLAFNYAVSSVTCEGPLLVRGAKPFVNQDPLVGQSRNGDHMSKRHECVNFFRDAFGYLPLVDQVAHVEKGIGAYQS